MVNEARMSLPYYVISTSLAAWLVCAPALSAQEVSPSPPPAQHGGLDAETLKTANDPMAAVKALNLQNYVISDLYGTDATANQFFVRYAQPFGPFLVRATMPF